jgi:hypothetical protein
MRPCKAALLPIWSMVLLDLKSCTIVHPFSLARVVRDKMVERAISFLQGGRPAVLFLHVL